MRQLQILMCVAALAACGGSDDTGGPSGNNEAASDNNSFGNNDGAPGAANNTTGFVPEIEEFAVRAVASTDRYVFVPNSADEGTTVARIDGRDLSITPIPVGLNPGEVVAFTNPAGETISVVLVHGTSVAAVIRADANAEQPSDLVHLLPVPAEVNALVASDDGRHVFAYSDPDQPLRPGTSVASLQAAALIRVGVTPDEDVAHELSVTRLIRDVEIVDEGRQLYIVGREGVNRIVLDEITQGTFVPPLDLQLTDDVFPPTDLEIEVAQDGSFFALRSSAYAGVSLHPVDGDTVGEPLVIELPGIPTDIDLYVDGGQRLVLATVRSASTLMIIDVDAAQADPGGYMPQSIAVDGASAGLTQLTPDLETALLYSTLPILPTLSVFDFASQALQTHALRNAIRSVAVSPDSRTAIIVHDVRAEDASTFFQSNHGLTILDIPTGYRRPLTLQGEPIDIVLTTPDAERSYLFALLASTNKAQQGVLRVDLRTFRSDFVPLARDPRQLGLVAGKIFVAQEATEGRITFIDVETLSQRTLSGYELNAGID